MSNRPDFSLTYMNFQKSQRKMSMKSIKIINKQVYHRYKKMLAISSGLGVTMTQRWLSFNVDPHCTKQSTSESIT